jgi:hypothetical protein
MDGVGLLRDPPASVRNPACRGRARGLIEADGLLAVFGADRRGHHTFPFRCLGPWELVPDVGRRAEVPLQVVPRF